MSEAAELDKEERILYRERKKVIKNLKRKKRELLFLRIKKYGFFLVLYLLVPFLIVMPLMTFITPVLAAIASIVYYVSVTVALTVVWFKKRKGKYGY